MPEISLQPKQSKLLSLMKNHPAPVIGVGGGRGAAKSSGADRCVITLMHEWSGLVGCMVMRNFDQVYKYHIEPIRRDFPWCDANLKTSMPASLKIRQSQLDFSYAENMDDIVRRFRSGNYDIVIIDQAEQFSGREIREIRKATRSRGGKQAKLVLLFNMRGSGIQDLRKWFHLHEVNKDEDPNDYVFLKVNPWDNVEWVRAPLREDGYTVLDYYRWTDEQRKEYAAKRGPYTKQLATDDEVIRKADWEGDWDSLEGTYYANQWDLEATRIHANQVEVLRKNWATHWLSQDYGTAHWCSNHWHYRVTLTPSEVVAHLGWNGRQTPLNVVVTYREMLLQEMTTPEIARRIIDSTPVDERAKVRTFFLSPECVTDDPNSVGSQLSKDLRAYGMPGPIKADNDRIGGWALLGKLLLATKQRGIDPEGKEYADCWMISSECAELLKAIPMAMRDPKNLDDVLKTDKSAAKIEQDILDDVRYGLKSMLAPKRKTDEDIYQENMSRAEPSERMILTYKRENRKVAKRKIVMPPSWKSNLR